MNLEEARTIIHNEGLGPYGIYEENGLADAVFVQCDDDGWFTYVTGERGGIDGKVLRFSSEELALEDFVDRLRLQRRIQERHARERAERREARRAREAGRSAQGSE